MKALSLKARMMFVSALLFAVITTAGITFFREMYSAGARSHRSSEALALLETADTQFDRMTIGMRGFMLDPGNKSEWEFKEKADEKAAELLEQVAKEYGDFPALVEKIKLIQEYDELHMHKMEMEFASLVEQKRLESANEFYFKRYLPTRRKMESLVNEARSLGVKTEDEAQAKAEYILTTGGSILLGITLLSLLASFYFNQRIASGVTRSIQALTEKLSTSVMSIELASKNTASASQQIATSATENASAITETLSISESGKKESDKGKNVVGRMADTMVQVADSNSRLESLIKVIEDIQSKTKVINDIVFETRLLSFNASIEAARAGVHGKGFAVVAEEVGKLAAVSGKAAEEINALLANSTHHVRDIVQTTSQRVNAARDASQQCEQVFEQMSHAMSEINRAMADMERETHHNSASSEEMANQAQTLALEARALTGLLGRLKSVVSGADQQAGAEAHEYAEPAAREMAFNLKSSKPTLQVVPENPYNVTGDSIFRSQNDMAKDEGSHTEGSEELVDRADTRWKNSA